MIPSQLVAEAGRILKQSSCVDLNMELMEIKQEADGRGAFEARYLAFLETIAQHWPVFTVTARGRPDRCWKEKTLFQAYRRTPSRTAPKVAPRSPSLARPLCGSPTGRSRQAALGSFGPAPESTTERVAHDKGPGNGKPRTVLVVICSWRSRALLSATFALRRPLSNIGSLRVIPYDRVGPKQRNFFANNPALTSPNGR